MESTNKTIFNDTLKVLCNLFVYRSPIKAAMERQKQQHKVGWLNSPNVYVRQDVDEIGTQHPKKITKVTQLWGDWS